MEKPEPIAIIGSGCRFPGNACTPSKLWDLLRSPTDLLTDIPEDRFNTKGFYHENGQYHGHTNVKQSYLLSEDRAIRRFDAQFFGISPAEANVIDPQMRLLLETVYEALESAGQTIEDLQGTDTAVYTGLMAGDYEHFMGRDEESVGTYHVTGTSRALLSNRVSYFFDWHGPSMTIDTACSSSLYAVHYAVQQLRASGSRVAVAAGAHILIDPLTYITESKLQMLSPTSRSRMWDADADGYARGEGVAAIVLKTLSAAEADGDHIECIIRETAVNQDGRTKGITMPSPQAQTKMIIDCYNRAGLDICRPTDRPQYFEAHGTGTPAGDPVEAEAISSAFFGPEVPDGTDPLFVGSVKTVIGHTEGTAGLASILKASLALRNSTIPPNMLFNRLSPRVEPFAAHLRVPTSALPWPDVPSGNPRRASVNSFGFGGANAHAILESYSSSTSPPDADSSPILPPFIFSAASEAALVRYLESFHKYLVAEGAGINMVDLAYTLNARRSRFPFAVAFSAFTSEQLASKIQKKLEAVKSDSGERLGIRVRQNPGASKPRILGIFTGQGAQWARMGAELMTNSPSARRMLERLEARLACLPAEKRPAWSLTEELLKDASTSLMNTSTMSQTLCTAVQILLVDILRSAHVEFTSVVGHSSGEIAAAYAVGLISAEDAICIAYYRGVYAKLSRGAEGQPGAMMAVGSSIEDIQELLQEPEFEGRACIAAVNSPASLTISGDADVIEELGVVLKDEKKFVRRLKVDKAYHSHHMIPCSADYLASLEQLDIPVLPYSENAKCTWISTAYEKDIATMTETLKGPYWDANMRNPVLFMQGIKRAYANGPFDLAIEVGPHPALKGPVLQTIQEISGHDIPYTGLLQRGRNDVEAVVDGLGYISTHLGKASVDFDSCELFATDSEKKPSLVAGLPSYAWSHEHEYWHESRYTKAVHKRSDPVHEILGHLCPNSTEHEMRWRNLLRPKELLWMKGHQLQNQIVFPAAGYVVAALEASMLASKGEPVSFIEVIDLNIGQALTFDNEDSSVEILFSMTSIRRHNTHITAEFSFNASVSTTGDSLASLATGSIHIRLGEPSASTLPPRNPRAPHLIKVKSEDFYRSLEKLEYQYSDLFVALSSLERKLGAATGFITNVKESSLMVHPALLDVGFQSIILAAAAPNDNKIWSMHVPTKVGRVRINPELCKSEMWKGRQLPFDANNPKDTTSIYGDVDIFPAGSDNAMIQVEGLLCVPFSTATAKDDRHLFSSTLWAPAVPNAEKVVFDNLATPHHYTLARKMERVACFYLRNLERSVPMDDSSRHQGPFTQLFKFASDTLTKSRCGPSSCWEPDWETDTAESIAELCKGCEDIIDFRLLHAIGEKLPDIATNRMTAIEIGMKDQLLTKFYQESFGMREQTIYLSRTMKQITQRSPRLHCLEIGAGTGGATKAILRETQSFSSYTFTDISSGFFESTRAALGSFADRMIFKTLDISADPCPQGFEKHSYDLIVASAVLHATPSITQTLKNVRRLLKPGGYLVVLEVLKDAPARVGTMFGAFPGWWLGQDEGRGLSPCLNLDEWDDLLRKTGFSGCDTQSPNSDLVQPVAIFVSQAVDKRMAILREPLSHGPEAFGSGPILQDLVLIGGKSPRSSGLVAQLRPLLQQYCGSIHTASGLQDLRALDISLTTTVLNLSELDKPVFDGLDQLQWMSLQSLLQEAGTILWITQGRRASNPHANMVVGLLRCAINELAGLNIQFLDFETPDRLDARIIAGALLRLKAMGTWQNGLLDAYTNTSIERELVIDDDGELLVPRLVPNSDMNNRLNSSKRPIFNTTTLRDHVVSLQKDGDSYVLEEELTEPIRETIRLRDIETTQSLASPISVVGDGRLYLSIGKSKKSHTRWVALSAQNASLISPEVSVSLPASVKLGSETAFLRLVSLHHLAAAIFEDLADGDNILIHEPAPESISILLKKARKKNIGISFTSTSDYRSQGCFQVHPNAPERTLRSLGIKSVALFLDLSTSDESRYIAKRIRAALPSSCRIESTETVFGEEPRVPTARYLSLIKDDLQDSVLEASTDLAAFEALDLRCNMVNVGDIHECKTIIPSQSILDWTVDDQVPTKAQPVDSKPLFSGSKTYWLAGLTSTLGISLCEWMIRHGARYIVMSSRRPNIDETWIEEMAALGAVVKVYAIDITKKNKVVSLYAEICATMPPVAGVAQGAMVLNDMSMSETPLETAQKITRPKVEGSLNLNDLFQEDTLDFFVFFSSFSSIVGVPGQSIYAAANMFMISLAEQRRRRGLAASVIDICLILGAGYITEKQHDTNLLVTTMGGMHMSEQDFHQMFAEAVIASKPSSPTPLEISAGPRQVRVDEKILPKWTTNPMFGHMLLEGEDVNASSTSTKQQVPLETQLAEAKTIDEVRQIVRDATLDRLRALFRLDVDTMDQENIDATRLDELGIDSLVAVEIRAWLLKAMLVNYPVLKILSGISVGELVTAAVEGIPREKIPNVAST
ncbi:polyketide synthase-like protein [Biscogniauxia mediterranea]|nr:polyketide synthase-like protein [Biscogniauxia mediterranea]